MEPSVRSEPIDFVTLGMFIIGMYAQVSFRVRGYLLRDFCTLRRGILCCKEVVAESFHGTLSQKLLMQA